MVFKPSMAEGFVTVFASSRKAHLAEMLFRLVFGTSLGLTWMSMWQPQLFRLLAWTIILSSIALLILPWQFHQRFGSRVIPVLVRHMRLYGLGVLAFGVLIGYGVYGPQQVL
jgi:phosphoglycerol transferase MdoB-like AlkP superfamily enzyme